MKNDIIILDSDSSQELRQKKEFVDKGKIKYLSEKEFKQLKVTLDNEKALELKLIVMLQYSLCLRANEVLRLKCSDFELKSDQGKNYFVVNAHNSKQKREVNRTKELAINTEVAMLFLSVKSKCKLNEDDYICRTKHNKVMSKRNYDKYLKKFFEKAGISRDKAHSHIFRHSRAIHLLNKGLNIAQVQRILGHTSIMNTMIYAKYSNYDINRILLEIDD